MAEEVAEPLSGKFEGSFAFRTIARRLPVILTKIADSVYRKKDQVKDTFGETGREDLKAIAGAVSRLKNEVQTDKPVVALQDDRPDASVWNTYLQEETEKNGRPPSWFTSPWLYVECYMYRRVQEAVLRSSCLTRMDVFEEQKEKALTDSSAAILILLRYLMEVIQKLEDGSELDTHKLFQQFTQVALWGNRCDLSISAGMDNAQTSCPLDQVTNLKEYILIDDLDKAWTGLKQHPAGRVDIVLDNAGFELLTDLCLAEFLLSFKLASTIHLHGKAIPWFVSDVTAEDFQSTQLYLQSSNSIATNFFAQRWQNRLQDKSWILECHDFWTMPFDYSEMKTRSPDLYFDLRKSNFIFLKGDLNYRKLVGDRNWKSTLPFLRALRGFNPAPLLALRALKADVVVGLKDGEFLTLQEKDSDWMVKGDYAVMSYCGSRLLCDDELEKQFLQSCAD